MMRRKRKNKKFIVIAIALLLLISIGYASISTTLTITGTAKIAATSWNVYFNNLQVTNGSVTPTTAPTVSSTNPTRLSYQVTLEKPGDFYEFTVDVVNGGTINAKIADDGVSNTALTSDQDTYVNYTVTYLDGTAITAGDKLLKSGQTIDGVENTRTIKVRVEYDSNISATQLNEMGNNDLTLALNFSLDYVQD